MPENPNARLAALFDGTAAPAAPKTDPKPDPKPEPEARAEPPEPDPKPESASAAPATAAPEPAASGPADDDAQSVETLSDLAQVLGVEVSELYNLRIPVTSADGGRSEVGLGEWKDAYQSSQQVQKLQRELEQRRAAIEQQYTEAQQRAQQSLKQTDALLNAAERQLLSDYESVDWNRLRADDPADWAAKRQDFIERQSAIQRAKQEATTEADRLKQETAEKTAASRAELLRKEQQALIAALPEWRDETKAKAEQAQLVDYLVGSGFDPNDVGSVSDHRVVLLARKAMMWDQRSKDGQEAKRKLVKIAPKMLKPGAAQSKQDQQVDAAQAVRSRLKKTGDLRDFAALFQRK